MSEVDELKKLCADIYQIVGVLISEIDKENWADKYSDIEHILDVLNSACQNKPYKHTSLLPFFISDNS
jgi:hypothetical protein